MGNLFNRWSFYLLCFYVAIMLLMASKNVRDLLAASFGIHPLEILFYGNLVILLCSIIGFYGLKDWKSALRSIFTVGLSLVITVFLIYILYVGNLADL